MGLAALEHLGEPVGRRATMATVAPRSASIGARAAPIPDDAPVTRTCGSVDLHGAAHRYLAHSHVTV